MQQNFAERPRASLGRGGEHEASRKSATNRMRLTLVLVYLRPAQRGRRQLSGWEATIFVAETTMVPDLRSQEVHLQMSTLREKGRGLEQSLGLRYRSNTPYADF
jgi:hypothetical protein